MYGFARAGRMAAVAIAAWISFGSPSDAWSLELTSLNGMSAVDVPAAPVVDGIDAIQGTGAAPTLSPAVPAMAAPAVRPRPLSKMIIAHVTPAVLDAELECLATAVYFEARSETHEGQVAVAEVILNRAASGRYPASICGVVFQPAQFSFVRKGRSPAVNRDSDAWHTAVAIADIARQRLAVQVDPTVLWYHASYVSPEWGRRLKRVAQIGLHIFYS